MNDETRVALMEVIDVLDNILSEALGSITDTERRVCILRHQLMQLVKAPERASG